MLRQHTNRQPVETATKKKETPQAVKDILSFNVNRLEEELSRDDIVDIANQIGGLNLDTLTVVKVKSGYIRKTNSGYAVYAGIVDPTNNDQLFTISGVVYDNGKSRHHGSTITPGSHSFGVVDPEIAAVCLLLDRKVNPSDYASQQAETVAASDNDGLKSAMAKLASDYAEGKINAKEFKSLMKDLKG